MNPEKKGGHVTQFLLRSTTKKAKNFSIFTLNRKPGMFGIKIFSENQAFLAYSFFGQQFKVKPAIALYTSTLRYQASACTRASRGKITRKFNFMFAFSACLYFRFKRIVETLEMLRLLAVERVDAVESVVKSTTDR